MNNQVDPKLLEFVLQIALYGMIAFGVFIVGVTIVFAVVFWRGNLSGDSIAAIVQKTDAPRLATIILIVVSASVLGLLGVIRGEAVIALLSGIAGYVLGNQLPPRDKQPGKKAKGSG